MTLPDPGNRVGIRRIEQIEVRLDRVAIVDLELFRYPLIPDLHERLRWPRKIGQLFKVYSTD